jgi:hypothetical protein
LHGHMVVQLHASITSPRMRHCCCVAMIHAPVRGSHQRRQVTLPLSGNYISTDTAVDG